KPLDGRDHSPELLGVFGGERPDAETGPLPTGSRGDIPLLPQLDQRTPNGPPAHATPLGELRLDQPRPGGQSSADDQLPPPAIRFIRLVHLPERGSRYRLVHAAVAVPRSDRIHTSPNDGWAPTGRRRTACRLCGSPAATRETVKRACDCGARNSRGPDVHAGRAL